MNKSQQRKPCLFDIGASFANDVFVKLLEDRNGQGETVLDLQNQTKKISMKKVEDNKNRGKSNKPVLR